MLYRWLPTNEKCNVPKYAHTVLGVGAFVFNKDTSEILVVKEKYTPTKASWKLPGGYIEPGTLIEAILYLIHYVLLYIYMYIYNYQEKILKRQPREKF